MSPRASLNDLWKSVPPPERPFDSDCLRRLPEGAQRYIEHAIVPGTPLASAVRLRMHGEIKLNRWFPFSAEQVLHRDRGMIWRGQVKMDGLPLRGGNSLLDGIGAIRWKLFGILPVASASGPNITRSTAGRANIETIWLPSVFCSDRVLWTALDNSHIHSQFTAHNETAELDYIIDDQGGVKSVSMQRWGNPEDSGFRYTNCGAHVEEEGTFDGYTIPTRLRIGWYFGTKKFDSDGEFFRVTIDDATFR